MKYIFVVGGVMSSVGKGIATASIGKILQGRGFRVSLVKCDMYVNIDAGTIRPTEHGEVFVGEDGIEADLDLSNYERFNNVVSTRDNYLTTGQVYLHVIEKERNLEYNGEDVEVVPDIPNEIIRRIKFAGKKDKAEITIVEIGGTVGEYQNILFLEAARMMRLEHPKDVLFVLVSYLPIPSKVGEMKTKPTQYAARTLNAAGIQPDFILCRAERPLDDPRRYRISTFCNVKQEDVVSAPDVDSVYEVPIRFEKEGLSEKILKKLGLKARAQDLQEWSRLVKTIKTVSKPIKIGVVGKYFNTGDFIVSDSYISVIEAIKHSSWHFKRKPEITWLNSEEYEKDSQKVKELQQYDGIVIPGGFGSRGVEGKIKAIQYARQNNIPYLGLCYGMQLAVIEFARNVAGMAEANTTEINPQTNCPVIDFIPEQKDNIANKKYGASMRLGAYKCRLNKDTISAKAYKEENISERHRHRYEFNNEYRDSLVKSGLVVAGVNPERDLVEIIELKKHPFFVGTQFHPEFKSRPLAPHPLFREFVRAAIKSSSNRS